MNKLITYFRSGKKAFETDNPVLIKRLLNDIGIKQLSLDFVEDRYNIGETVSEQDFKHVRANPHVHDSDEIRYFKEGVGCFYFMHDCGYSKVFCENGDIILIPAGRIHWFESLNKPFNVVKYSSTKEEKTLLIKMNIPKFAE